MSTTTTTAVATQDNATSVKQTISLPAIDTLDVARDDGSKVADVKKAESIWTMAEKQAVAQAEGYIRLGTATAALCELSWDFRELCLRQDGTPDYAGKTAAYALGFWDRLSLALRAQQGMTLEMVKKLQDATRRWDFDNGYRDTRLAAIAARKDSSLAIPAKGEPMGEKLALAVRELAKTQTTSKGSQLAGFELEKIRADKAFGVKPPREVSGTDTANGVTPSALWEKVAKEIGKRNDDGTRHLAPLPMVDSFHRIATAITFSMVGEVEGTPPKGGISDRPKVIATLTEVRDLLTGLLAVMDTSAKVAKDDTEHGIVSHLWHAASK